MQSTGGDGIARTGRGSAQFQLRLPEDLRERIKRAADRSGRSMNGEIVHVLEEAFPPRVTVAEMLDTLDRLLAEADQNTDAEPPKQLRGLRRWLESERFSPDDDALDALLSVREHAPAKDDSK